MTNFTLEIQDQEAKAALAELLRRGQDLTEPMADIARALRNAAEDAFQNEASPFGAPWEALAASTIKARERGGHWPGSILQLSGGLAASVGSDSGPDWAEVAPPRSTRPSTSSAASVPRARGDEPTFSWRRIMGWLAEIRAAGPQYTHRLRQPADGWPEDAWAREILPRIDPTAHEVAPWARGQANRYHWDDVQFNAVTQHEFLRRLVTLTGMRYSRHKGE